jgi:hypothetical protein
LEALENKGLKKNEKSTSGKAQLEGVLGFAADLKHAEMMAKDYRSYFQKKGDGELRGRKIKILGEGGGKISQGELNKALQTYRKGEIDGIVAIVSGQTQARVARKEDKKPQDPILAAVERGEIEAVFTVDVYVEGADLMFTHHIGARPFSRIARAKKEGAPIEGPDEVRNGNFSDSRGFCSTPSITITVIVPDPHGIFWESNTRPSGPGRHGFSFGRGGE